LSTTEAASVRIEPADPKKLAAIWPEGAGTRVDLALVGPGDATFVAFATDAFDSEMLGLRIGRILHTVARSAAEHQQLLRSLATSAKDRGYDQILRRVRADHAPETWALETVGFALMDIGLTFTKQLDEPIVPPSHEDLEVRAATPEDIEALLPGMMAFPWGTRYEADPAYASDAVARLRARWLQNCQAGRSDIVLVGILDGVPAGYVTCAITPCGTGSIDLVGTDPRFRGRRVAFRVLEHATAWFSSRTRLVNVRTQATNIPAAKLYEKSGFTLGASDLTFRLALSERGGSGL
jgi:ribosomal protein S18 acetylase RimI-like enzyme